MTHQISTLAALRRDMLDTIHGGYGFRAHDSMINRWIEALDRIIPVLGAESSGVLVETDDRTTAANAVTGAISLRDAFAGAALQGLLATPVDIYHKGIKLETREQFCEMAYRYADSMMEARKK